MLLFNARMVLVVFIVDPEEAFILSFKSAYNLKNTTPCMPSQYGNVIQA